MTDSPARDETPHRYTAELAAADRAGLAGPLGRRRAPSTRPTPPARGPSPRRSPVAARSCSSSTCSPTRAAPGLHVGHPLGYIATDVFARYHRMTRQERPALPGLRRVRPAGRAVRRADRPAPAQDDRGQHGRHEAPAAPAGAGPRRPPHHRDDRPGLLQWTQWIFLQIYNSWYDPEAVRPDGGAGRARPIAELVEEFASGRRPLPAADGRGWADLSDGRAGAGILDGYRLAYTSRGAGQLGPGPGHGAVQRGGHQRGPLRARQLPGLQDATCASG